MLDAILGFITKLFGPGIIFGALAGGALIFWADRAPDGWPNIKTPFFGYVIHAPQSLAAQRDQARTLLAGLEAAEQAAAGRVKALKVAQTRITVAAGAADAAAQARIAANTQHLAKEIPAYVTPSTDARFPLPWGLVRVHDAAALGLPDPGDVSLSAGAADDAASSITARDLAAAINDNYGACRADDRQLIDLQQWIRDQAAASAKALGK